MRRAAVAFLGALFSCGGDPRPAPLAPRAPESPELTPAPAARRPPQYTLSDPDARPAGTVVSLDEAGAFGAVLDGARVVVRGGVPAFAPEVMDRTARALRVPPWLGGGFLFHTQSAVYASATFDGPLRPLIALDRAVSTVSFGPTGALLRSSDGDRLVVSLPAGARVDPSPAGLVDVAMIADGRVAVITEGGGAAVSWDRGDKWTDVTARLAGAPAKLLASGQELWLGDHAGRALRIDPAGALTEFAQLPPLPRDPLRPKDPRWRPTEPPLRRALRLGARRDDTTALVATDGDVVQVDLATGAVVGVVPGKLPPEMTCEAVEVRVPGDVVFVCAAPSGASVVVTQGLGATEPRLERTFASAAPFYASDDGTLVFAGGCAGGKALPGAACARAPDGEWLEVRSHDPADGDPDPLALGVPSPPRRAPEAARWIARPEGGAVAVALGSRPPATDQLEIRGSERRNVDLSGLPPAAVEALRRSIRPAAGGAAQGRVVDRTWTMTARGSLRGWLDGGQSIEIPPDGKARLGAFSFPRVAVSGQFGFAVTSDARTWQSSDGGGSWVEVLAPPAATATRLELRACSSLGCDLGAWARIGWEATPPEARPPLAAAGPAPRAPRPQPPELACVSAGESRAASLPPSESSPADFGVGLHRIPVSRDAIVVSRRVFPKGLLHPLQGASGGDEEGATRAIVHGFGTQLAGDPGGPEGFSLGQVVVLGPNRSAAGLVRELAFVEPFDPAGPVRRASFTATSVLAAARAGSVPPQQVFDAGEASPDVSAVVPVLSLEPGGASDLVFAIPADPAEILGTVRGGSATRAKVAWSHARRGSVASAVATGPEELAVLAIGDAGEVRVFRLGATSVTDLHELAAPPTTSHYPANPDALALGAQGALAVVRTPSGSTPPTSGDPAWLIPFGGAPAPLAPWSALTGADDPACRADAGGWRAVIHAPSSWLRLRVGGAPVDVPGALLARVRWSRDRVCLEAVEVRGPAIQLAQWRELETYVVARFTARPDAGLVGVSPGVELRQPLRCTLVR